MISCVIIEDEKPAQRLLKSYIEQYNKLKLLAVYDSAVEAEIKIVEQADILFLDIKMPQVTGLSYLRTLKIKPEVIITTAFPDYAIDAIELEICDYLLKPYLFQRFFKAVQRAEQYIKLKNKNDIAIPLKDYFFIYVDKAFHRINKEDILFLKSDGDYVHIVTSKQKWMINGTLKNWLEKLSQQTFLKVHHSYIVQIRKIDKLEGNRIFIESYQIPVSRANKANLVNALA